MRMRVWIVSDGRAWVCIWASITGMRVSSSTDLHHLPASRSSRSALQLLSLCLKPGSINVAASVAIKRRSAPESAESGYACRTIQTVSAPSASICRSVSLRRSVSSYQRCRECRDQAPVCAGVLIVDMRVARSKQYLRHLRPSAVRLVCVDRCLHNQHCRECCDQAPVCAGVLRVDIRAARSKRYLRRVRPSAAPLVCVDRCLPINAAASVATRRQSAPEC